MDEEEEKEFMNIDGDDEFHDDADGDIGSLKFDEEADEDPEDRFH